MKRIMITLLYLGLLLTARAQCSVQRYDSALSARHYFISPGPGMDIPAAIYHRLHKPRRYKMAVGPSIAPGLFCFSTRLGYKINRCWGIALKNECITQNIPGQEKEWRWLWELSLERKFGAISVSLYCENIFDIHAPDKAATPVVNAAFKELYTPAEGREIGLAICIKL